MGTLFLINQAKRLLALPVRAGAAIRQLAGSGGNGEAETPDNILVEFESATANLVQAVDIFLKAKSQLQVSEERRDQSVADCDQAARLAIASFSGEPADGVPIDEVMPQS